MKLRSLLAAIAAATVMVAAGGMAAGSPSTTWAAPAETETTEAAPAETETTEAAPAETETTEAAKVEYDPTTRTLTLTGSGSYHWSVGMCRGSADEGNFVIPSRCVTNLNPYWVKVTDAQTGATLFEASYSSSPEPTSPEPTSPEPTSPEPTSPEPTSPEPTDQPGVGAPVTGSDDTNPAPFAALGIMLAAAFAAAKRGRR